MQTLQICTEKNNPHQPKGKGSTVHNIGKKGEWRKGGKEKKKQSQSFWTFFFFFFRFFTLRCRCKNQKPKKKKAKKTTLLLRAKSGACVCMICEAVHAMRCVPACLRACVRARGCVQRDACVRACVRASLILVAVAPHPNNNPPLPPFPISSASLRFAPSVICLWGL